VYEPRRKPGASQGRAVDAVSNIEISAVLNVVLNVILNDDKQVPHQAFRPVRNDKVLIFGFAVSARFDFLASVRL
jgi:hypothetical protein